MALNLDPRVRPAAVAGSFYPGNAPQLGLAPGTSVTAKLYPNDNAAGKAELTGTITILTRSVKTTHDGLVECSITFQGNGALVEGLKV